MKSSKFDQKKEGRINVGKERAWTKGGGGYGFYSNRLSGAQNGMSMQQEHATSSNSVARMANVNRLELCRCAHICKQMRNEISQESAAQGSPSLAHSLIVTVAYTSVIHCEGCSLIRFNRALVLISGPERAYRPAATVVESSRHCWHDVPFEAVATRTALSATPILSTIPHFEYFPCCATSLAKSCYTTGTISFPGCGTIDDY